MLTYSTLVTLYLACPWFRGWCDWPAGGHPSHDPDVLVTRDVMQYRIDVRQPNRVYRMAFP
jgi:hypothetical protein